MSPISRRRSLRQSIERVEDRKLLAADFMSAHHAWFRQTPEQWAEVALAQYQGSQFPEETGDAEIGRFDSEQQAVESLRDFVSEYWGELFEQDLNQDLLDRFPPYFLPYFSAGGDAIVTTDAHGSFGDLAPQSDGQVEGVSEQDVFDVTADGFLFKSAYDEILIFDVSDPENIRRVGEIDTGVYHSGLYIEGDRLIALSWNQVNVFDVSDRENPEQVSEFEFEGWLTDSRLANGNLVLTVNGFVQLPTPQFIRADGVGDGRVRLSDESLGQFETEQEYLDRVSPMLVASFLPNVTAIGPDGEIISESNLGDWQDLIVGRESIGSSQATVLAIDITSEEPTVLDSETIMGASSSIVYADTDTVYFSAAGHFPWDWQFGGGDNQTEIYRIDLLDGGNDVSATAAGTVVGEVTGSENFSEYENNLRVTTGSVDGEGNTAANLYVLRDNDSQLEVIGSLEDIAEGQSLVATYFSGAQAVITTAKIDDLLQIIDPLHTIDLSDPTDPVEEGEVEIPGVATTLRWIDETHLIGIGYIIEDQQARRQVSLYDVSDRESPIVLSNYTGESQRPAFGLGQTLSHQEIHYDAETGILIIPESSWWWGQDALQVLQIDVDAEPEDRITLLGEIEGQGWDARAYVSSDYIISTSHDRVTATPISSLGGAPENPAPPPPTNPPPQGSEAEVAYVAAALDTDGNPIDGDLEIGDRFWVQLSADRLGDEDNGIFQAVFSVTFDREAFDIVGEPEALEPFGNRVLATESETGFSSLGGFSSSTDPIGEGPQAIIRFQLEVKRSGSFAVIAAPSMAQGEETLVYGEDSSVLPENIRNAELNITARDPAEGEAYDINDDGFVSPSDVLMVVNYLNNRSSGSAEVGYQNGSPSDTSRLDINGDSIVSPLDALVIINQLNARSSSGEGESNEVSEGEACDHATATDSALEMMAAASLSQWESERRR